MNRILIIKNKLLSLRGRMNICDEQGNSIYDARGEISFLRPPTWTIASNGEELAYIRRKVFALSPTWIVTGKHGSFRIKRKLFSLRRQHHVLGGRFDGAVLNGNLLDLKFEILHQDIALARAKGRIMTVRDVHEIEVLGESEPFVVICMVVLQMSRREESKEQSRK